MWLDAPPILCQLKLHKRLVLVTSTLIIPRRLMNHLASSTCLSLLTFFLAEVKQVGFLFHSCPLIDPNLICLQPGTIQPTEPFTSHTEQLVGEHVKEGGLKQES